MCSNSTKGSFNIAKYSPILSSSKTFSYTLTSSYGKFHPSVRSKLRIDFIRRSVERKKDTARSTQTARNNKSVVFFAYSSPLIISHENGTAGTIKQQKGVTFPLRTSLGNSFPPS